jgi:hypothetical protein
MVTTRELAIAASVIHASLEDYPLTLEELHGSLIGSRQTMAEIVSVFEGSDLLRQIVERRDGFFFPAGRSDLIDERRRREARSRAFLDRHALLLRLVCCLPFVRLVALSGRIARLNLEAGGDLDLFIVTRVGHVWSTAAAVKGLSALLSRRCMVRAKVVLDEDHLELEARDLDTAVRLMHLRPLIGGSALQDLWYANPFVVELFPNAPEQPAESAEPAWSPLTSTVRMFLALIIGLPSPAIEALCRWWQAGGDTLVDVSQRPHRNNLFEIFPDLPWLRPRAANDRVQLVHQQVEAFRERAKANIERQRASAARMRARITNRKGR